MNLDNIVDTRKKKTIYRDGDDLITLFNEDCTKTEILTEALNDARVEEVGLNTPKLKLVTNIDGKWAIVSEFIEGKKLSELMDENPDKLDEYLNMFVDLQINILVNNKHSINSLRNELNSKIMQSDLPATVRYDLYMRVGEMRKHNRMCHGDFTPENVIIRDDGKAYILDWSHVARGNAGADCAISYINFLLTRDEDIANKYLEMFIKKYDMLEWKVRRWIPIVAAAKSTEYTGKTKEFLLNLVLKTK